jgi:prevent-host-death family protein
MEIADIRDAGSQLSRLVERALDGEEVLIAESGTPVVRLVPVHPGAATPRRGGQWKGRVRMADDFDALPDDLSDAFGIGLL